MPPRYTLVWVTWGLRIGFVVLFLVALTTSLGTVNTSTAYRSGYTIGLLGRLVVAGVVFRFASGRWGCAGVALQMLVAGWFGLGVLTLFFIHPFG